MKYWVCNTCPGAQYEGRWVFGGAKIAMIGLKQVGQGDPSLGLTFLCCPLGVVPGLDFLEK